MSSEAHLALLGSGILAAVLAFALAVAARRVALRVGAVCAPRQDRWSTQPVPLLGGVAIVLATVGTLALGPAVPAVVWILIGGAVTLALVGLVDDLRPITPYTKLAAQLAVAGAVTAAGLRFPLTEIPVVDILITVAWLVGFSNAFNLLDNMDGLAAGVAAIAGGVRLTLFVMDGDWAGAMASAALTGACLGFLALNFNPARIFMGDAGSLFLGFFIAGLSAIGGTPDSRATASVLIGPLAVMMVPIFDTVLVTVLRVMAGRPISQGGRDHSSHRLVAAGLSPRRAVLTLYGLAAVSGGVGIVTRQLPLGVGLTLFSALGVAMLLLGVALSRIKVYQTVREVPRAGFRMPLPPARAYVRQFATAGIDGLLVVGAYYAAHAFRLAGAAPGTDPRFVEALPLVFSAKMLALAVFRANNRVWRYTNSHDLLAMTQASTMGSALATLGIGAAYDLAPFGAVLALDWILLTSALGASRLALRGMAEFLRPAPADAARVVLYGAGDAGVMLLQELRNNPAMGRVAVAFLDDDPMKQGTRIQGASVFAPGPQLADQLRDLRADELIIATTHLPPPRLEAVRAACLETGVALSRFRLLVESLPSVTHIRSVKG